MSNLIRFVQFNAVVYLALFTIPFSIILGAAPGIPKPRPVYMDEIVFRPVVVGDQQYVLNSTNSYGISWLHPPAVSLTLSVFLTVMFMLWAVTNRLNDNPSRPAQALLAISICFYRWIRFWQSVFFGWFLLIISGADEFVDLSIVPIAYMHLTTTTFEYPWFHSVKMLAFWIGIWNQVALNPVKTPWMSIVQSLMAFIMVNDFVNIHVRFNLSQQHVLKLTYEMILCWYLIIAGFAMGYTIPSM